MTESGNIVADTAARIFADLADPQSVNQARGEQWKEPLWSALEQAGLPLAWVDDKFGGSGASLADGFAVLGIAGRFAAPVPLAETMLAGWLLAQGGIPAPKGAMTVVPPRPHERMTLHSDGTLSGTARGVPFAKDCRHVAVMAEASTIALVETNACRIGEGQSLGGDAANTVTFARTKPICRATAPAGFGTHALAIMGATVRAVEIAGALESVLAMSVRYANERVAFERPIGKFQAVQQNLARLAGETAAALAVSGSAADTLAQSEKFDEAAFFEAASAKIRTAEAAAEGASIAHQVHGAIGFTNEHVLHRFTLRMLGWRDDFGNESHWATELGKIVAKNGADRFWPMLAAR